ncbi:MAG TPA: ATP synthase F1 subunit epsilon [Myxococcota bacterium]|nr:ATP synthase F1 subunit epsilon [Myxococcota bacterium]
MLRLNVVTPERPFLEEDCQDVTLPASLGEMQVLPGHAAILSELSVGIVSYQKRNNETVRFMVSEGFVEVAHDRVNVLCEQARFKSEIDRTLEEALLRDLESKLKMTEEAESSQKRRVVELERCVARLSLFD